VRRSVLLIFWTTAKTAAKDGVMTGNAIDNLVVLR